MISYRQADLLNTLNKPKKLYFPHDNDEDHTFIYDPVMQMYTVSGTTDWTTLPRRHDVRKIGDFYVVDDEYVPTQPIFIGNDYVGEYDHIDEYGNFVFKDHRHSKFFGKTFSVKDWVLTDNHERGMLLQKRI